MLFEVIAERWHYRPRRCSMTTYLKGEKGYLPDSVVLKAQEEGYVKVLKEQPDV